MNRKTALAAAGATALVVVAGTVAVGANLGVLGLGRSEKAGYLSPVDMVQEQVPAPTVTLYKDETTAPSTTDSQADAGGQMPEPQQTVIETVVVDDTPTASTGEDDDEDDDEDEDDGEDDATPEPSHSEDEEDEPFDD